MGRSDTTRHPISAGPARLAPALDPFLEAKLHKPPDRSGWVRRQRLIERVAEARHHPVTLVSAPAGYGKTILVAQWLATDEGPLSAWVSLDEGDNDPNRMWAHVAAALDRTAGRRPAPGAAARRGRAEAVGETSSSAVASILDTLASAGEDIVLVLDDFHFIRHPVCYEQVEALLHQLPPQAHVVIVARSDPGLRLGRVRASGQLVEIRAADLVFLEDEATSLLEHQHVTLTGDSVATLVERTEGWPAGLYLAILSLQGRAEPDEFVNEFSGSHRFVGDYLTEEVLSRQPAAVREFITTISVLDRFCASLCDHVTGHVGSGALLRDLQRTNLFLVPLDPAGGWFRFHHLFAAVARTELELEEPDRLRLLHARAADWFAAHDHVDDAIHHFIAAGRPADATALVRAHWLAFVDAGRLATVLGWLERLPPVVGAIDPEAVVIEAWLAAFMGDEATLTSRLGVLGSATGADGPAPASPAVESALAMIRGLFGYGGPVDMLEGARRATELETDRTSPFRSVALAALGHASYVVGDLDGALPPLVEAAEGERAPVVIRVLALATQAMVWHERDDPGRSHELAQRAVGLIEDSGPRAVPQASLAYSALGQARASAGQVQEALADLDRALEVRREVPSGPWGMIHHLLVHARVAAMAGQPELARELLDELAWRTGRYDEGMEAVRARIRAVARLIDPGGAGSTDPEALTQRELDVLQLLQGPLSVQQIAAELYLSSNTVKTHARAVYRKLGAHTRTEAVGNGRRQHLL